MGKLATLLTDFTDTDGYPAVMRGVMLSIAPDTQIIDISHSIPPHDVFTGMLMLGRCAPWFPPGAVHVCVVDPGVGTERSALIAKLGGCFFAGPDNGLLTPLYRRALEAGHPVEIRRIENNRCCLNPVSATFHGRDIFAPAAAHLLNGVPLADFGSLVEEPVLLETPQPARVPGGWEGQVIHVDAYGNLATNFRAEHLALNAKVRIIVAGQTIHGLRNTFGEGRHGELVAMLDSDGYVSVCVVNGSASRALGAIAGDRAQLLLP